MGFEHSLNRNGDNILTTAYKIVIVAADTKDPRQLRYTFGQVAVDQPVVDYAANCGNLTAAVAPFEAPSPLPNETWPKPPDR